MYSFFSCLQEAALLPESWTLCLLYEGSTTDNMVCRTYSASSFEKTCGLMLLSKNELLNPKARPYVDESQIRGFLTASVRKGDSEG